MFALWQSTAPHANVQLSDMRLRPLDQTPGDQIEIETRFRNVGRSKAIYKLVTDTTLLPKDAVSPCTVSDRRSIEHRLQVKAGKFSKPLICNRLRPSLINQH